MLHKLKLRCTCNGDEKVSYNWGSLLHGVLIESLPKDMADMLHENNLRPFSQYVLPLPDNSLEWHFGLWDDEYSAAIVRSVMALECIEIKKKNVSLEVVAAEHNKRTEREYFAQFFDTDLLVRRYQIEFLTPCTHKQAGEYVLFPTPELIIQSLQMRFSAYAKDYHIDDPEALKQIVSHLRIIRYSLRSAQYHLEGTRIRGYLGRIVLGISGPEQLTRLTGMLLSFGEYAGIGIKTSLGMGSCRITGIIQENTGRRK